MHMRTDGNNMATGIEQHITHTAVTHIQHTTHNDQITHTRPVADPT